MVDIMCSYGLPLFDLEDNSTLELIRSLRKFRAYYEPYHGYLCTVICSFGILTNLINVVVLTKRQMRTSINVLLTGIAFCDMGTMLSYLIYIVHFVLADHLCNPSLYTYGWMFFLMCHVMVSIALHTTTLWLSVAMAFIRNMTLRQTRVGSPWLRSDKTWKICAIVYGCVFALCLPNVFSNGILPWHEYFNETCTEGNSERMDRTYRAYTIGTPLENCLIFTVTFWLTGTLFKIIPCVLLALLIFSLLFTIKRAEKNRKALFDTNRNNRALVANLTSTASLGPHPRPQRENSQCRSDRTTAMLLMILGLSLLTELPQGAISILSGIYVAHMHEYVYPNVADILDLLSLINSSVNFILYCIMSSKYRQVFWQVVLPRKLYVRLFIRPRQSARNHRSRHIRRSMAPVPSGLCPEAENLCAVSNLLNRRSRKSQLKRCASEVPNEETVNEDTLADEFTTNDLATERFWNDRTSPRLDREQQQHQTPLRNGRDGRRSVFTFSVDQANNNIIDNNPTIVEDVPEPWTPSPSRLRSLLLPKSSPKSKKSIVSSKSSKKTVSRTALLQSQSMVTSDYQNVSTHPGNDHFVNSASKTARRMFTLFQRKKELIPVPQNNNEEETPKHEPSPAAQWLVGCSCLCRCAFKSGLETASAHLTEAIRRHPSVETVAIEEAEVVVEPIEIPVIVLRRDETIELIDASVDDARRLLCSPAHSATADRDTDAEEDEVEE